MDTSLCIPIHVYLDQYVILGILSFRCIFQWLSDPVANPADDGLDVEHRLIAAALSVDVFKNMAIQFDEFNEGLHFRVGKGQSVK